MPTSELTVSEFSPVDFRVWTKLAHEFGIQVSNSMRQIIKECTLVNMALFQVDGYAITACLALFVDVALIVPFPRYPKALCFNHQLTWYQIFLWSLFLDPRVRVLFHIFEVSPFVLSQCLTSYIVFSGTQLFQRINPGVIIGFFQFRKLFTKLRLLRCFAFT